MKSCIRTWVFCCTTTGIVDAVVPQLQSVELQINFLKGEKEF